MSKSARFRPGLDAVEILERVGGRVPIESRAGQFLHFGIHGEIEDVEPAGRGEGHVGAGIPFAHTDGVKFTALAAEEFAEKRLRVRLRIAGAALLKTLGEEISARPRHHAVVFRSSGAELVEVAAGIFLEPGPDVGRQGLLELEEDARLEDGREVVEAAIALRRVDLHEPPVGIPGILVVGIEVQLGRDDGQDVFVRVAELDAFRPGDDLADIFVRARAEDELGPRVERVGGVRRVGECDESDRGDEKTSLWKTKTGKELNHFRHPMRGPSAVAFGATQPPSPLGRTKVAFSR